MLKQLVLAFSFLLIFSYVQQATSHPVAGAIVGEAIAHAALGGVIGLVPPAWPLAIILPIATDLALAPFFFGFTIGAVTICAIIATTYFVYKGIRYAIYKFKTPENQILDYPVYEQSSQPPVKQLSPRQARQYYINQRALAN